MSDDEQSSKINTQELQEVDYNSKDRDERNQGEQQLKYEEELIANQTISVTRKAYAWENKLTEKQFQELENQCALINFTSLRDSFISELKKQHYPNQNIQFKDKSEMLLKDVCKIFIMKLIEEARTIQEERSENGLMTKDHARLAYTRIMKQGFDINFQPFKNLDMDD